MSLFDSRETQDKEFNQWVQEMLNEEKLYSQCLAPGATIIEVDKPENFVYKLSNLLSPQRPILGEDESANLLKKYRGRSIVRWEVKSFRKYDAVGSMYKISHIPKDLLPIIVIENITDIPDGDHNIYEDPEIVENILLHTWEKDVIHLTHHQDGPFEFNAEGYVVLFPVRPGDLEKLYHPIAGKIRKLCFEMHR
ncbi:MAG: hypothetical protein II537_07105 [Bacteroidales bacterium]|nr:hypothetical protein [Bacteroidales bacterium]